MLKIWDLKKKADEEGTRQGGKITGSLLRIQKDITDLVLPDTMHVHFPDPNNLTSFKLYLEPDEGYYRGGRFEFTFNINSNYPIEPPKVRCEQKIFHPNIDLDGNICLNILREDWKPVLSLNSVLVGIQFLFLEPNQNDPLNKAAAHSLQASPTEFAREVTRSMLGHNVNGEVYDCVAIPGAFRR